MAYQQKGLTHDFYQGLLDEIEDHWITLLNKINNTGVLKKIIVGQNFVWHDSFLEKLNNCYTIVDKNWIEVIADTAGYNRPARTTLVTGWIFDTFVKANNISGIKSKDVFMEFCLPLIEQANSVNKWLDESEYNGNSASKHPDRRGHKMWADYLLSYLND